MTATVTKLVPDEPSPLSYVEDITATSARKGSQVMDDLKIDEYLAQYILGRIERNSLKDESFLKVRTGVIRGAVTASLTTYYNKKPEAYQAIRSFDTSGFLKYLENVVARHITTKERGFQASYSEELIKGQTVRFLTITW